MRLAEPFLSSHAAMEKRRRLDLRHVLVVALAAATTMRVGYAVFVIRPDMIGQSPARDDLGGLNLDRANRDIRQRVVFRHLAGLEPFTNTRDKARIQRP